MMMSVSLVRGDEMIINGYKCDSEGKRIDRFHLETTIMEAWQTVNDLKLLYSRLDGMTEDQVMGSVDGVRIFADMRFNELWDTFEAMLENMRLDATNYVTARTAGLE